MNSIRILLFAAFAACQGILSCSPGPQATGPDQPGSGTEVVASLVNEDGSPAVGVTVYLRPADYLPNVSAKTAAHVSLRTMAITTTDTLGNFAFDSIAAGTYTLECLDGEAGNGALIESVTVVDSDSTVELATDTLKPLGSIAGQIQLPESLDASQIRVMVYGLDRIVIPDSTGDYVISGLAEGTYSLRIQIPGGQGTDIQNVAVPTADTARPPTAVLPGADKIYAPKVPDTITVDGILDEANWNLAQNIVFEKRSVSENRVTVRALWDSLNLYFAYEVEDTLSAPNTIANDWSEVDAVEIFLDPEHDSTSALNDDDLQFLVNLSNENELLIGTQIGTQRPRGAFPSAIAMTAKGYNVEIAIPWTLINKTPAVGLTMGALFGDDDNDNGASAQFDWLDAAGTLGSWKTPSAWGDLILK